jgi:transcription termination/antitermination protein NusA
VNVVETMDRREARVFVPEDQLSLAIGKGGQNVRLAAKLTGWKIDVRSSSDPDATQEGGVATSEGETLADDVDEAVDITAADPEELAEEGAEIAAEEEVVEEEKQA